MFRNKAIGALIVMAVAGVAVSGTGLAQATTAQPTARAAAAGHTGRAPLPGGVTLARHPRATVPTPRFVQAAAPADVFSCYATVSILSHANQQWVSAELAYWGSG